MNPWTLSRYDWLSLGLVGGTVLLGLLTYGQLPETIPTHWNSQGVADGYSSKPVGTFMMPFIGLMTILVMKIVMVISPKGFRLDDSRRIVDLIQLILVALFCAIGVATLLAALGFQFDMAKVVLIGTGLMLAATGNIMSKVRKNFFVGIRTPWTLADDEVWAQTHRFAGRTFFVGGVFVCLVSLVYARIEVILAGVGIAVLAPVIYSYVIYRRLNP
ncbi:MAG: SdpI family protein [Pseudomonadota bacterium]